MKKLIVVFLGIVMISLGYGVKASASPSNEDSKETPAANESGPSAKSALAPPSTGLYCKKEDTREGASIQYKYESLFYPSGDRYVSCQITVPTTQAANSMFYRNNQAGVSAGECFITYDDNGPTSGYWTFSSQNGITRVVYNDANSAGNNTSYTFVDGDCTKF